MIWILTSCDCSMYWNFPSHSKVQGYQGRKWIWYINYHAMKVCSIITYWDKTVLDKLKIWCILCLSQSYKNPHITVKSTVKSDIWTFLHTSRSCLAWKASTRSWDDKGRGIFFYSRKCTTAPLNIHPHVQQEQQPSIQGQQKYLTLPPVYQVIPTVSRHRVYTQLSVQEILD